VIRRFLPIILSVLLLPIHAQVKNSDASDISALTTTFDPINNEVTFSGNARLSDGTTLLEADEIKYVSATDIAIATGHVSLTRGAERVLSDKITYDRREKSFSIDQVRAGKFPYFVSGESAYGDFSKLTISNAVLSVREPDPYQPTLAAKSLTYVTGKELNAEEAHLGIGNSKLISIPRFSQNINLPLVSYISVLAGYRSSLGAFAEVGMHAPIGADLKLGGTLGLYSDRGIMFGPSGYYAVMHDNHEMVGDFRSGFINDHGEKLTDLIGRAIPENRGYVQWWHTQDLTDNLRITAQLNYWRDSEILRDFKPRDFFRIQEPDNYFQAVYSKHNYIVTAFTRVQPNDFHLVQQRLPEISFDLLPVAMGGGFYEKFHVSYAALREEPLGNANPVIRSDRLDAYYAISHPITHEDWFSFTPIAGARLTHYSRATGGKSDYTRTLGEVGFDAEFRMSAVSEYRNETWKINGIRHLFKPKLSYRYVGNADKGRPYIPAIDTRTFNSYLTPIGLGDRRNVDDLGPINVLRFGLDNTWQTRDEEYGSRDLLVLNFANDVRFDREPGQRTSSDLHSFLAFMPAQWLQLDFYQRLATQEFTLQEYNTSLSIRDADVWALRFSSHFLRDQIEEYVVQYDQRINEAYDVLLKLHYDTRARRFNEQAYGLRQNLGNTWSIEYLVTVYDGPRRESDFGFNIAVEVLGF
jgi:LPS-assembly protein